MGCHRRAARLHLIANNTRFLIVPWVQSPCLASHVLGLVVRRIGADWRRDMEQRLDEIQRHPEQNLGFIEEELARAAKEPLRLLAERAAQTKANGTRCLCPKHKIDLERQRVLSRSIDSGLGEAQDVLVIADGALWI